MFVHGFTGSPDRTWTHKRGDASHRPDDLDGSEPPPKLRKLHPSFPPRGPRAEPPTAVFWPRDLLPKTIPDARVLTYGYDTHLRHKIFGRPVNKMTLNDIAREFLVSVEAGCREEPSRPIMFVCHSLGGIVVKEMLRQACSCPDVQMQNVFNSTIGIVFFGTPHRGADPRQLLQHIAEKLARIAGLSINQDIVNTLLPTPGPLRQLNDDFSAVAQKQRWSIYSFQEAHGVRLLGGNQVKYFDFAPPVDSHAHREIQVVEDMSSYLGLAPLETTQHINRDHMEMCRFTATEDAEYQKVAAALRRMTASITSRSKDGDEGSCETLCDTQRTMLLESLRFEQIDSRFKSIKTTHGKTCCWFLKSRPYLDWRDAQKLHDHHGFLWIKGKPGTGKSTLMKFLFARFKTKPRNKIFFFFNARGTELEKTTIGMYRSLLLQLLGPRPSLWRSFDAVGFMAWNTTSDHEWSIESLKQVFEEAVCRLERFDSVTCFIDALDECGESEIRDMVEFFERLADSAVANQIQFQVVFSSRHYPHVTISKSVGLVLEREEEHSEDIQRYVEDKLKIKKRDGGYRERILDKILEKAAGVFMWVVLVVDILNQSSDQGRPPVYLLKKLEDLPSDLHELFHDILMRDENHKDELLLCLQWVLFARRPLRPEELYYAIHAGISPQFLVNYTLDEEQVERFILNSSKGLAEVTNAKTKSVQFIHESVRDFLLRDGGLKTLSTNLGSNFEGESHDRLKTCCVEYINMNNIQELIENLTLESATKDPIMPVGQEHPFLEYATYNILYHANAAADRGLVQEDFLRQFSLPRWVTLHNLVERFQARHYKSNVSLLYVLAENNLASLIPIYSSSSGQTCLDIEEDRFGTPLFAARATKSDEAALALMRSVAEAQPLATKLGEIFEMFLQHMVLNTSSWTRKFRFSRKMSLSSQALANSDSIIALFILSSSRTEDENKTDVDGRVLLSWAAAQGKEAVVKFLLANGADIETKDDDGRTPLSWAAIEGKEAVVQILLTNGAEIETKDNDGRTPLSRAAYIGGEPVVQILLANGAEIETKDNNSWTPLSWAAYYGNKATIQILLTNGAEIETKDNYGRTPLSLAAFMERGAAVQILLANGAKIGTEDDDSRILRLANGAT